MLVYPHTLTVFRQARAVTDSDGLDRLQHLLQCPRYFMLPRVELLLLLLLTIGIHIGSHTRVEFEQSLSHAPEASREVAHASVDGGVAASAGSPRALGRGGGRTIG